MDLLFRWRQDGALRMYARRLTSEDLGQPFVAVTEPGQIQPLHMVLSVPSKGGWGEG